MSLSPERGAAAFKASAALAAVGAGSLALAGPANPRAVEKPPTPTLKKNEVVVDQLAQLAVKKLSQHLVIQREERERQREKDKIKYTLPHSSPNYTSTTNMDIQHSTTLSVWLETLRNCESGGNYSEDTGNGFLGAYQFLQSTWTSLGYSGTPNEAPPSEQDAAIIKNTEDSTGGLATQNPGCYHSTGISAYPPS